MLASCVVVLLVTPVVLVGALPLVFVYLRVQRLYVATNRELKRLNSLAFSPIFSHLSESLQVRLHNAQWTSQTRLPACMVICRLFSILLPSSQARNGLLHDR